MVKKKNSAQWTTSIRHIFIVNYADKNNPLRYVCAHQCEIETPRAIVGFAEIDQTQRCHQSPPRELHLQANRYVPTNAPMFVMYGSYTEEEVSPEVVPLYERCKEIRISAERPSNE